MDLSSMILQYRRIYQLNRLIYIAVDQEVIRYNPLEDVKYEKKKAPQIRHITRSQLQQFLILSRCEILR